MIRRLRFNDGVNMVEVEETIHLSIIGAECLHGKPAVRLEFSYTTGGQCAVLRSEGDAGRTVMLLVVGFCAAEYGNDSFKVERCDEKPPPAP